MAKTLTTIVMALLASALSAGASAQGIGQTLPGVAPSVPSPGGGSRAPAIAPGPAAPIAPGPAAPRPVAPGAAAPDQNKNAGRPRIVKVPGLPTVVIPSGTTGRNSYSDRVARCVQYGTAAGVPTSEMGRFTSHCAR